jgi:REP element-mobilizing transposase RayT
MGHTFASHLYHVIFSTKGRLPLLRPEIRDELYKYMCGVARKRQAFIIAIGGSADHVHLLAKVKPVAAVSQVVGAIKANSSRWLSETCAGMRAFEWQPGYSSFSVSESVVEAVKAYIGGQEEHHRRRTFAEELRAFLDAHGVEYDPAHFLD